MTEREAKRARKLLEPIVAEDPDLTIVDRAYDVGNGGRNPGVMIELTRLGMVFDRFYKFSEVEARRAKWNERQESLGQSPVWK